MEAGSWIDVPGGAYGDEQIALLQRLGDARHVEGHLAEPHDVRTQIAGRLATTAHRIEAEILADIENESRAVTAHLQQFPVHVQDIAAPSALVQVVYILGDQ